MLNFSLKISLATFALLIVFNANSQVIDSSFVDDNAKYIYNLFEADRTFINDDFSKSEQHYLQCLDIKPDNPFILYRLASISFQRKDFNQAELYIDKCLAFNDSNEWYLYLAGNIYTYSNHYDKAIAIFNKLISIYPNEFDFYACLSDIYVKNKKYKKAIQIYDSIEDKFGIDESVILMKKDIYLLLKDKKKAENELLKLVKTYPNEYVYRRLVAGFYSETGQIQKSIDAYNSVLNDVPNDGYSHIGLASCYQLLKENEKFFSELKIGFVSKDVTCAFKVDIIYNMLRNQELLKFSFEKIVELSELLVKHYPDDPDVNTLYADLMIYNGNIEVARLALNKVVETRKDKYQIWNQLLLIEHQLGDWLSLYKHSTEALQYFTNLPSLYLFNGISSFQLSKYEQAFESLSTGYEILLDNDPMQSDFLNLLGEVCYRLDNKETAYHYFELLLEKEPDNLMILNNYSYYLSLDKVNLEKAKSMSFQTINKEPENPTYLDTYAWILFEMKQYSEALKYIRTAVENDITHSDVIIEHYGDILYFNNDSAGALEQWNRAKLIGNGSDKLDEKIKSQKYIE